MISSEALQKLIEGNKRYIESGKYSGDVSEETRILTAREGQHPYAVILCCSDSREIPEAIFSAGIGDLFVIRVAGNVIGKHELGSIEYAAGHLGCPLVLILGHDHCGAVGAALHREADGDILSITDEILEAAGNETDEFKVSCLNVKNSVKKIKENAAVRRLIEKGLEIRGAIYRLESGAVELL